MKHTTLFFAALLGLASLFSACRGVELQEAANANLPKASNLRYTAEGRTVTLAWNLTDTTDVRGVQVIKNGSETTELSGAATSFVIRHCTPNKDILYTVKVLFRNGLVSDGASVRVHITYDEPIYVGYLLTANTIDELPDDDEIAAARWFNTAYVEQGKGLFVHIGDSLDLDKMSALWIHIDRVGLSRGWQHLTGGLNEDAFRQSLRAYCEEGGRLFLSCHATQLLAGIGRIAEQYTPNEFSSGDGGTSDEPWTLNAYIGETYDHRSHRFFDGLTLGSYNGYSYTTFPMASAGHHEDHNCMWNLSSFTFSSGSDKTRGFELATNCTVLGTWGQNTEFAFPGFVLFSAEGTFHGEIVAMGLGCYEWNQEGNQYQSQIEKLTANILDYLRD